MEEPLPFDISQYRVSAERFLEEIEREYFEHYAGRKETTDFAGIYDAHAVLFTEESIRALQALKKATEDDASSELYHFALDGFLGQATKELYDKEAEVESTGTVLIDGEETAYRMSASVQTNEADRDRRRRIEDARIAFTSEELNPIAEKLYSDFQGLSSQLGYQNYLELCRDMRAVNFEALLEQTEAFLAETEDVYRSSLDEALTKYAGIGLDEAGRWDLPYLFRAPQFDDRFTKERLIPSLHETLHAMGIDLAGQSNIEVDAEVREQKSPRAFCATIKVPSEIKLVVMPVGGQDDYQALFHEAGHAEHFAHTDPELAFEYRHLGDNGVTEGFAFLFEHLMHNRGWLKRYLEIDDADEFLRFMGVVQLYFLRRYSGKLAYEMELHQKGPSAEMAQRYTHHLTRATLIQFPAENYLTDVDEGMYCTSYLRAWIFEANVRELLKERFGEDWHAVREAGSFIKELWGHGQRYRAEKLLGQFGVNQMNMAPLSAHIAALLRP